MNGCFPPKTLTLLAESTENAKVGGGSVALYGPGAIWFKARDSADMIEQLMDTLNGTESWFVQDLKPTTEEIQFKYYPDDNETSFWMYAMITVGSAFVIFVFITVYLMCHSTIRQVAEEDVKFRAVQQPRTVYRTREYQRTFE